MYATYLYITENNCGDFLHIGDEKKPSNRSDCTLPNDYQLFNTRSTRLTFVRRVSEEEAEVANQIVILHASIVGQHELAYRIESESGRIDHNFFLRRVTKIRWCDSQLIRCYINLTAGMDGLIMTYC